MRGCRAAIVSDSGSGRCSAAAWRSALRLRANAAATTSPQSQAKGCILIWLDGGPTHYETFDPKPDAPKEIRGEFKAIVTKAPGVRFSEHLPRLAGIADKLAVIRSIRHDQGNHGAGNHYMMTGAPTRIPVFCGAFVSFHPSLGSVTAKERGAPAGLPAYFALPAMTRSGGPNFLGAKYAPFVVPDDPNSAGFRVRDVNLPAGLAGDRFAGRSELRHELDRMQRINDPAAGDPAAALDEHYVQAFDLMSSRAAQAAFDLNREPDRVRAAYGRTPFGQRALLARRLIEAGVPFITLQEGGWDHHSGLFAALKTRLPSFDQVVATLIQDLDQRGLLGSTIVTVLGEFGRTPQINAQAGRDHWSNAMSVLFAGGGSPGGQAIGATDVKGYTRVTASLGRRTSRPRFTPSLASIPRS